MPQNYIPPRSIPSTNRTDWIAVFAAFLALLGILTLAAICYLSILLALSY